MFSFRGDPGEINKKTKCRGERGKRRKRKGEREEDGTAGTAGEGGVRESEGERVAGKCPLCVVGG